MLSHPAKSNTPSKIQAQVSKRADMQANTWRATLPRCRLSPPKPGATPSATPGLMGATETLEKRARGRTPGTPPRTGDNRETPDQARARAKFKPTMRHSRVSNFSVSAFPLFSVLEREFFDMRAPCSHGPHKPPNRPLPQLVRLREKSARLRLDLPSLDPVVNMGAHDPPPTHFIFPLTQQLIEQRVATQLQSRVIHSRELDIHPD